MVPGKTDIMKRCVGDKKMCDESKKFILLMFIRCCCQGGKDHGLDAVVQEGLKGNYCIVFGEKYTRGMTV